jgi:hypothetical protein
MVEQFLDKIGLSTFLTQLEGLFATKKSVMDVKEATDLYIFEIDYDNTLKFNTDLIISGSATSATLGVGQLGAMILGNP